MSIEDRGIVSGIIRDVLAANPNIPPDDKPNIHIMSASSAKKKYQVGGDGQMAKILRVLMARSIVINNYLADMQDKFGKDDEDFDSSGDEDNNANVSEEEEKEEEEEDQQPTATRRTCNVRYCKGSVQQQSSCAGITKGNKCGKSVHQHCSNQVLSKNTDKDGNPLNAIDGKVFCTKKCYESYMKHMDDSNLSWCNDGPNGKDDPHHSERKLANWLAVEGNLRKYRGGPGSGAEGETKDAICQVIASRLKEQGSRREYTAKNVRDKIEWFQRGMRKAIDYTHNTGAGVRERDGVEKFDEALTQIFPYYHDLIEVFADRAGFKPKLTTDNLDSDDDKSVELIAGEGADGGDAATKNGGKRQSSQNGKSTNKKTKHTQPTPQKSGLDKKLDKLLEHKIKRYEEKEKREKKRKRVGDDVLYKVKLAKNFKEMVDSLDGDKIKAASIVPAFQIFLSEDEAKNL